MLTVWMHLSGQHAGTVAHLNGERMAGTSAGCRRFSFSKPFSLEAGIRGIVSRAAHCTYRPHREHVQLSAGSPIATLTAGPWGQVCGLNQHTATLKDHPPSAIWRTPQRPAAVFMSQAAPSRTALSSPQESCCCH